MGKEITVVVPTYNEEKGLEKFLKQFKNQTLPRSKYELIIVDGDSTDNTRQIAEKYADKVIIQKSKGVGGARNDGVELASADHTCYLVRPVGPLGAEAGAVVTSPEVRRSMRGDWWMFGHDPQHTRRSRYVGAHTNNLKWTHDNGGDMWSSTAIGQPG